MSLIQVSLDENQGVSGTVFFPRVSSEGFIFLPLPASRSIPILWLWPLSVFKASNIAISLWPFFPSHISFSDNSQGKFSALKESCDQFGLTHRIQDKLPRAKSLTFIKSEKSLLPHKASYLKRPKFRLWASLGNIILSTHSYHPFLVLIL